MDKFVKFCGGAVIAGAGLFFLLLFTTLFGALSGFIVGLVFGKIFLGILAQFGLHDISMWEIGAFAGYFGGFFRTSVTTKQ